LNQFATLKNSMTKLNNKTQMQSGISNDFVLRNTGNNTGNNIITTSHRQINASNTVNVNDNLTPYTNLNLSSQPKFIKKTPYIFDTLTTYSLNSTDLKNPNSNSVNISNNNLNIINLANKCNIEKEVEDVFDNINGDELLDIINQNISIFEQENFFPADILHNDENTNNINLHDMDHNMSNNKRDKKGEIELNRSSGSKMKVVKKIPDMFDSSLAINLNNEGYSYSLNTLTTPAKIPCSPKEEIKSELIVKKLLELRDRQMLDGLLEKYNLKICFDSQVEEGKFDKKEKETSHVIETNMKKIECPICFDGEEK
jgi:hypothetical protein